jgi:hypothetical protein
LPAPEVERFGWGAGESNSVEIKDSSFDRLVDAREGKMKNQPLSKARYLGMTITQVIVLACFGLVTLGVVGFGAWTVLRSSFPGGLFPTREILPTWTPLPTRTLYPTRTPAGPSPTPTEVDYQSLIPEGWVQFTNGKVEIWMPNNFEKADPGTYLISAKDSSTDQNFQTNILVGMNVAPSLDMDVYIRENVKYFPTYNSLVDMTLLEKKKFSIGAYEAMRLKIETIILKLPVEAAMYLVKEGDKFWIITCSTYYEDYHDWLPTFDKIARTFRVNP